MLNAIFIIQSETGILLFEKIFFQEINNESIEIFRGFLTAIKQFTSEMVVDGSKELKSISLGDSYIKSTHIPEIKSDLVLLIDKVDEKSTVKLMRPITEIILKYQELFLETEQQPELFKNFDQKINQLVLSKKVIDNKIIERKNNIFKSIWSQEGAISTKLRKDVLIEKEKLLTNLENQQNLINKSILLEKLIKILEKLDDKVELLKFQKELQILNNEIKDRKIRLSYYLRNTKLTLKDKDYKTAYSNLYSFSNKLENLAKSHVQKKYKNLAKILMNREEIPKIKFSQTVSEILMMSETIEEYFI